MAVLAAISCNKNEIGNVARDFLTLRKTSEIIASIDLMCRLANSLKQCVAMLADSYARQHGCDEVTVAALDSAASGSETI